VFLPRRFTRWAARLFDPIAWLIDYVIPLTNFSDFGKRTQNTTAKVHLDTRLAGRPTDDKDSGKAVLPL
jgi:hypothetical protein